ncbi:hypothetical protein [Marinomonas sp. GJ51-6]|uniref:hypothetical protein n=1 Tax=Marinomonas sp. GJ51-6 TaxID=2992802 RepID=UPI00293422B9|nr:hypothetical protein [Marinomonas sp. GJ51-6]WOD06484.1 hypothetical protein ONZ50_12390 [Marinomonas sp. GJ51-6]
MKKQLTLILPFVTTLLSAAWWWKEGGYEPVIVFIGAFSALILSVYSIKVENSDKLSVLINIDHEVLDDLYTYILQVEGAINKSFLDRLLWNELQENLDQLKCFYHENKIKFPDTLDRKVLEIIMVGRNVMSLEINRSIPNELVNSYRSSKENVISEIRLLKGIEY